MSFGLAKLGRLLLEKRAAQPIYQVKAPGALKAPMSAAHYTSKPPGPKTTATRRSGPARSMATAKNPSNKPYFKDMLKSYADPQRGWRQTVMG